MDSFDWVVLKFGGTSVGMTMSLTQLLSIVLYERERWERLILVVSALDGVTDQLIEASHLALLNNRRGYRRIVATLRTRHLALIEYLPLGITERKLGKFSDAEAVYQHTIAIEPNYAPAYLNLGVLYDLYLAQPQKALEQFEHYLTLAGDNKQVAGWVIELRKRVGPTIPAAKREPA